MNRFSNGAPPSTDPDFCAAALYWFARNLTVIPILPETKTPAVKWDHWVNRLSAYWIRRYWQKYPHHQIGHIVGDDLIVYDADSRESLAALLYLERQHGLHPFLKIRTRRGQHHYFVRPADVVARSAAFSSELHPDRIDIKTGRAIAILPPSTGKTVLFDAFAETEVCGGE